jgi:hypothetical protein
MIERAELEAEWKDFEEELGHTTFRINSAVQHIISSARNALSAMAGPLEEARRLKKDLERSPQSVRAGAAEALRRVSAGIEAARNFLIVARSSQMTRTKLALTIGEVQRLSDELQDAIDKTNQFLRRVEKT